MLVSLIVDRWRLALSLGITAWLCTRILSQLFGISDVSSVTAVLYWCIVVSLICYLFYDARIAGLSLICVDQRCIVVAENPQLLRLETGEVRGCDLSVDVSRLGQKLAGVCLLARWVIGLLEELAIDHVFAIAINNCYGASVDLLWCLLVRAHQEVRYVDGIASKWLQSPIILRRPVILDHLLEWNFINCQASSCVDSSQITNSAVSTVPATLHRKENTRMITEQIIVVEILHHQQSPSVVLVCRHHYVVR